MNPLYKRAGLLGVAALTLGACEFGLGIDHSTDAVGVPAGTTVTITNADGTPCPVEEEQDSSPVTIIVVTEQPTEGSEEEALDAFDPVSTETDSEGFFSTTVTAPDRPGAHMVLAVCGDLTGDEGPVLGDESHVDFITVSQPPLSITVDKGQVVAGEQVVATFSLCQNENDFGLFASEGDPEDPEAEPDPELEELLNDFPDLVVSVDGEVVTTIPGEERYPSGTVDVPLTLTGLGDHEISAVCTYQTFDLDPEAMAEEFPDIDDAALAASSVPLQAAAPEYPVEAAPFAEYNEASVDAALTVEVVAPASAPTPTPAAPPAAAPTAVVAQPTFTG